MLYFFVTFGSNCFHLKCGRFDSASCDVLSFYAIFFKYLNTNIENTDIEACVFFVNLNCLIGN